MKLFQELVIPDDKELYIIGDLHGCYDLYKKGSHVLGIRDEDVVISLGDLTDRGTDNFKCVVEFTRKENRYAIRGNHEDMMIRGLIDNLREYYECWYQNGGHTVVDEVNIEGAELLAEMVKDLPVVLLVHHRGRKLAFIHGGWPSVFEYLALPDIPVQKMAPNMEAGFAEMLMWDRDMVECAKEGMKLPLVKGVDYVFHGHSYVKKPLINGNRVYMDTGSCFNGNLTFAYFTFTNLEFYSTLEDD